MFRSILFIGGLASLATQISGAPTAPIVSRDTLSERWTADLPSGCYYPDYMAAPFWTGGSTDQVDNYCVSKWKDGLLITGLTTYTKDWKVYGLQATFSDGSKSILYGSTKGAQEHQDWDVTDQITLARMWGDGRGHYLGQIEMQTKSNKDIKMGNGRTDDDGAQNSQTGGGLLMGLILATDKNEPIIIRAGFLFIKGQVKEAKSVEFKFDDDLAALNSKQTGMSTEVLGEGYYHNARDTNATCTFSNSVTRQNVRTITQTNQHQVGASATLKFETSVFGLAKASTSYTLSYQYTHISTDQKTTSEDVQLKWDNGLLVVVSGQTIYCKASVLTGKYSGGYTSTIQLTLDSGAVYSFLSRGQLDNIGWASVYSECSNVDKPPAGVPELPSGEK